MARRPRLTFEGAIHHVTFRGNGRQAILYRDDDRLRFVESLEERIGPKAGSAPKIKNKPPAAFP